MEGFLKALSPDDAAMADYVATHHWGELRDTLQKMISDIDTIRTIVSDDPEVAPVTEYITDIDIRHALVERIRALGRQLEPGALHDHVNATMLGVFMVAPVDELQRFVTECENCPNGTLGILRDTNVAAPLALRAFLPTGGPNSANGPAASRPTSKKDRHAFAKKTKLRNADLCVFTGFTDPHAAHIFPYATSRDRDFYNLNSLLLRSWGLDQYNRWAAQYGDLSTTDSRKNGITMSSHLHTWFDSAQFALKPMRHLAPDDRTVVVQWHWLKAPKFEPKKKIHRGDSTDAIFQYCGFRDRDWGTHGLAHRESGIRIRTGQIFRITGGKPEDVPSWDLLELSWNLLRVAAICGAADVDDDYWDESDDDDESCIGVETDA
ncbi:hypothetical protein OQA88_698 [Cercophora sp. LCS_1]